MNLQTFKEFTKTETPPDGFSVPLEAMWYQGKGNWVETRRLTQSDNSPSGSWVHAHLHRIEGDLVNTVYCYRLAARPVCTSNLDDEWEEIVTALV